MVDLGPLVNDEPGALDRDDVPTLVILFGLHLTVSARFERFQGRHTRARR